MKQQFVGLHSLDDADNPAGGMSYCEVAGNMTVEVKWQDGPLNIDGVRVEPNGAFVETVIAIAVDRLQFYQESKFKCRENALAITKLEEALHWLNHRTADRESRGVEGTHEL